MTTNNWDRQAAKERVAKYLQGASSPSQPYDDLQRYEAALSEAEAEIRTLRNFAVNADTENQRLREKIEAAKAAIAPVLLRYEGQWYLAASPTDEQCDALAAVIDAARRK